MVRVAYPDSDDPDDDALVRRIREQRSDAGNLYRVLLHSPPIAEGWLQLMTAVRQGTTIPPALRELIIIRVGLLNRAPFEVDEHRPIALREGVSRAKLDALLDWERSAGVFDEGERAVLALTDQVTKDISVNDQTWSEVERRWTAKELVELVAIIASYNMVSRFLEALVIRSSDPSDAEREQLSP